MKTPSCWKPTAPEKSRLFAFQQWLAHHHHLSFKHYHELHHWSVQQFPLFWKYLTDFFKFPLTHHRAPYFKKQGLNYLKISGLQMQRLIPPPSCSIILQKRRR